MISLNDVLLAMSNIPVDDPIAEIWGRQLQGGYKIIEYTGALPITINANGDALLDYRIYGADGGVGVATESGEPAGYKLPMTVRSENLFDGEITQGAYATGTGFPMTSDRYIKSSKIRLDLNGYITLSLNCPKIGYAISGLDAFIYFWTETDTYIDFFQFREKGRKTVQIPEGAVYFAFSVGAGAGGTLGTSDISDIMLVEGYVPLPYQPYSNTTTPVYIGENQLDEGEYVDFGEQKIYRDVGGALTPTDPPVPLPNIPTIDGTTVIDYDGEPKPSQMYIKYKGKSDGA